MSQFEERANLNVRYVGGYAVIINRHVELDHYIALRNALSKTIEAIEMGTNPSDIEPRLDKKLFQHINPTITWLFDNDARVLAYKPYHSPSKESGACVYFMMGYIYGGIKIGYTKNLYKRTKDLWRDSGFFEPQIIAIAQTSHAKTLERLIHRIHKQHRKRNEIFEEIPVVLWLRTTAKGVRS